MPLHSRDPHRLLLVAMACVAISCGAPHDTARDGGDGTMDASPHVLDAAASDASPRDGDTADDDASHSSDDAGPDAGSSHAAELGDVCETDAHCGPGGTCLVYLRGGYCSRDCSADRSVCGPDGVCGTPELVSGSRCRRLCDPRMPDPCTRPDHVCHAIDYDTGYGACGNGCTDDADCPDGRCHIFDADRGTGVCYDPMSQPGDACTFREDCPAASRCASELGTGWPAGVCGARCVDIDQPCEDGFCVRIEPTIAGGTCLPPCTDDTDCRNEYVCVEGATGHRYCHPACTDDSQCSGARRCDAASGLCVE